MVSRRMGYTKWTIDPTTVFKRTSNIMMLFTHIGHTAAMIFSLSAAFMALPNYILMPMNLTIVLSAPNMLDCTLFTKEIFSLPVGHLIAKITFTINQSTIKRLLTAIALVEGTFRHHVFLIFVVPLTVWVIDGLHINELRLF